MSKTVHTAETEPAATEPADPRTRTTDILGAVIDTVSRYCDALVVSHPVAPLASVLWQDVDRPIRSGTAAIALPPIVATDARAAADEAVALASDGLRVAIVDTVDSLPAMDDAAAGRPLVRYRLATSMEANSDTLALHAGSPQQAVDYSIIAHAAAELSLCRVSVYLAADLGRSSFGEIVAPDETGLSELLGRPSDEIASPTAYQKKVFGDYRTRIPSVPPESLDEGRLLAGAEKILADVTSSYEKVVNRSVGEDPGAARTTDDESGLRVVIASTRAFALARHVASSAAGTGFRASVHGMPSGSTAVVEIGGGGDGTTDVLVSPGSARYGLESELTDVREGGSVLLQGESADPEEIWNLLPQSVREQVRHNAVRIFSTHSDDAGSDACFEDSLVPFLVAAARGSLPGPEVAISRAQGRSNGEAAGTPAGLLPFVFEIPWREFEESPNFYSGTTGLHLTDVPPTQTSDEIVRRLITFHNTGRHVGRRIDDAGLVPVQLFPYISSLATRGPYPVLVPEKGRHRPISLTTLIDRIAGESDGDDERERLLARMEASLIDEYSQDGTTDLRELWKRAADRVERAEADREAGDAGDLRAGIKELGKDLPEGHLHGFGPATMIQILDWTANRDWSARFAPVQEDAEALAVMMEEFLRADAGGSKEGGDPEHLRAAVGKAYADELDFEALARIVEETRVSEPLPDRHRERLEATAAALRQLPKRLAAARQQGVFSGPSGLTQAVARTHANLRTVAALIRAIRIALLESSGRYREDVHDPVFGQFGVEHLTDDERAICPPLVVDLGSSATLSRATRGAMMEVLESDLPVKLLLAVEDLPSRLRTVTEADPSVSAAAGLALQAVGIGTAYVMQGPASEVTAFVEAASSAARFNGPALFSLFYGSSSTLLDRDGYLASAVAAESRAFPVFRFDPAGAGWADRISIEGNPATGESWSRGEIEYSSPDASSARLSTAFTFADFLALDPRVADHFRVVPISDWQPQMVEIAEFIDLDETETVDRVPFLWMADERGRLERVVVTYPITDATRSALRNWRTIQELGGARSSFADRIVEAERLRLTEDRQRIAAEAEERIRTELDQATGTLAREIVSNIAAGLLGLRTAGGEIDARRPTLSPTPAVVDETEAEEPEEPAAATEQPEEEEEAIVLDDPYIETPRCTSCNECTNMNSRMFAYDQNKQAFIQDASAGTFRELVLAAEKCPVRIIHPGKPLNPEEPGLDELIKRAQPFQ